MGRKYKCHKCGKQLEKEERLVYSSKSTCKECYGQLEIKKQQYTQLVEIIKQYYNIDIPNGLMFKQIKEYTETFKYALSGITYSLWYCKEILHMSMETKYGIACVKYQYENAKSYFGQQQKIVQSVTEFKEPIIKKAKMSKVAEKTIFTIDITKFLNSSAEHNIINNDINI